MFAGKIEVERSVIVDFLGQCQLDVEEAFYAIQRKNLSELYKYLTSSKDTDSDTKKGEEKGKSDMDAMKERILNKTKDKEKEKEAYEVRNGSLLIEYKSVLTFCNNHYKCTCT